MQPGGVGDTAAGSRDLAGQQKLDRRSNGCIAPQHVRTRRHAEILHGRVEYAGPGIERHLAARDGDAKWSPRRGVDSARRTCRFDHQRVPFEADLRTVFVNQGEADNRLDGNRDRDSSRRTISAS